MGTFNADYTRMKLERKVFTYDSSEADKRFFKQALLEFNNQKTLTEYMFGKVWERNDGGKTTKYCFFNEHFQRVYLDRSFFKWCCLVLDEQNEIKKNE